MAVPDYQSLMLPVLKAAAAGEIRIGDVVDRLATELGLSADDLADMLPSGKQSSFSNRVHWAKTYLKQAGLVEPTRRAHFKITPRGSAALASGLTSIDIRYLQQFPEFNAFRTKSTDEVAASINSSVDNAFPADPRETPDDQLRRLSKEINSSLGAEIVERIQNSAPSFFERVVVSLLLAMGYGGAIEEAGKILGRSGDDGVDGVIDQDTLGLDRVYIQAKRYNSETSIGPGAIRDFYGSLDMHKASKGLFVTTSSFSKAAVETAERLGKRIVLIDGQQLANYLVKFNVGCRVQETIEVKKIDEDYFE
ncbi:MAG: restriction endonuclease [Aestuariivirga sp.]